MSSRQDESALRSRKGRVLRKSPINRSPSVVWGRPLLTNPVVMSCWPVRNPMTLQCAASRGVRLGVPVRTPLLAAHCKVMGFLTGQQDITTGLVSNGRPQTTDGERLIGLFLNTLPFRLRNADSSCRELIH